LREFQAGNHIEYKSLLGISLFTRLLTCCDKYRRHVWSVMPARDGRTALSGWVRWLRPDGALNDRVRLDDQSERTSHAISA
jgi:hypothetical protein